MAIDLAELRSELRLIALGAITPKNGVTGVAGVADVAPLRQKSPELRQLRPLRVKNTKGEKDAELGVAEGVAAALPSPAFDPAALQADADDRNREAAREGRTDRFCACRKMATVGVGNARADRGNPEGVARWLCSECFEAGRA